MKLTPAMIAQLVLTMVLAIVNVTINATVLTRSPLIKELVFAQAAIGALTLIVAIISLIQVRRVTRGTRGRGRVLAATIGTLLHIVGALGAGIIFALNNPTGSILHSVSLTIPPNALLAWSAFLFVAGVAFLGWFFAAIASWFLLEERTRAVLWRVIDVVLLFAAVAAISLLPSQPPASSPNALQLPVLRHVITTIAVMRLIVRVMPGLMDAIEALGFRPLIAARHLRSKKSGFLAAVSILAIGAVMLASASLIITLSVMGGFRNDLKRKILGNNAHVVIDRDNRTIERWEPIVDNARKARHVVGAAPYVSGEVMLSSSSNLATAVLRGIDTAHVGEVSDLPKNIRTGKLDYLMHPEKLLNLPPEVMGKLLLPVDDSVFGNGQANGDDLADQVARAIDKAGAAKPKLDDKVAAGNVDKPTSVSDALAEFLVEPNVRDAAPGKGKPVRDALPGIIIGQELARSLRLYLGDEVNVVAPLGALGPSGPMPKSRPFRVAGIFYSGMYEYDMKYTYVTLDTAQRFLNTGDTIHGVEIKAADAEQAPLVAKQLRTELTGRDVRVRDWQELNSRLFGALALEKLAMFIALGIAVLVASFCIAATLMLMVQEKGRQIAVLKAIGSPDRSIVGVFVLEGLMIGAFGSSLGLFLGYMICFAFEHFGIRMNPEVYYIDKLPVHIEPSEFVLVGIASVIVCLLVTIYPAILGSRLRPVEALRYE